MPQTTAKTDIPAKGDFVLFADNPGQPVVIASVEDKRVIVGKPGQNGQTWISRDALAQIGANPHGPGQFWSFQANWGKLS